MTGGRSERLTPVDRRILRLALPALGALAAEPAYRLVDTAIVGRIGTDELGGLAVATSVLSLVIVGANFLAYGTTERVARRWGSGDRAAAGTVGVQARWIALLVGAVSVPLLLGFAPVLTSLLGAEGDVLDVAVLYLRISAIGVPFVLVGLAAQGAQRGVSDYRSSLIVAVVANAVNVVVELVFVFGFDLGVAGAAWSTVLAQALAGMALWWRARPVTRHAAVVRPSWTEMRPLMNAGRHLLLRVASMLVVFTGATSIAARVDEPTLAAHQIAV
ncbi:MAG: MATE family efflux transporter, partial [Actinomycetota bacterium]